MTAVLGISAFYHDSAAALVVDGTDRRRGAGRTLHAQEARPRLSGTRARLLPRRGGAPARTARLRRLLRQAVPQVRAAARDISRLRAARVPVVRQVRAALAVAEAPPAARARARARRPVPATRTSSPSTTNRTPRAHSFRRRSTRRPSSRSTASANGPPPPVGVGRGNRIALTHELRFPHSLGLLYSAFTYFTGFRVNSGEYKLMGLAPYGEPRYADLILEHLIDLKEDGSFRMDMTVLQLLPGPDDDVPEVRRRCSADRRGRPRRR